MVTGQAPVTLKMRNTPEKNKNNQRWYTHVSQLTQFMPPPETYKSEFGSQFTMCQVHAGAYVSLLTPGKTDYSDCHPRKTTTPTKMPKNGRATKTTNVTKSISRRKVRASRQLYPQSFNTHLSVNPPTAHHMSPANMSGSINRTDETTYFFHINVFEKQTNYIIKKLRYTPAVRSKISSKLIFASCV